MEAESPAATDWRQIDGLRAHDALGERCRRNEKCPSNLPCPGFSLGVAYTQQQLWASSEVRAPRINWQRQKNTGDRYHVPQLSG